MIHPIPPIIQLALSCGVLLASIIVCLVALFGCKTLAGDAAQQSREVRQKMDALAAQLQAMRQEAASEPAAVDSFPGLNLAKRSQALRLYRRGDPAEQIAGALDVPRQEIELLVKVHRIVMSVA